VKIKLTKLSAIAAGIAQKHELSVSGTRGFKKGLVLFVAVLQSSQSISIHLPKFYSSAQEILKR